MKQSKLVALFLEVDRKWLQFTINVFIGRQQSSIQQCWCFLVLVKLLHTHFLTIIRILLEIMPQFV